MTSPFFLKYFTLHFLIYFTYFLLFKVTSHIQRPKYQFFFYLTELNSSIQPNFSIKTFFQKSLKAPEYFTKTYFQVKVIKSGRCHYLGPGRISWGNFRGNRLYLSSIFMLFHILFTSRTLLNSLVESLCL